MLRAKPGAKADLERVCDEIRRLDTTQLEALGGPIEDADHAGRFASIRGNGSSGANAGDGGDHRLRRGQAAAVAGCAGGTPGEKNSAERLSQSQSPLVHCRPEPSVQRVTRTSPQ